MKRERSRETRRLRRWIKPILRTVEVFWRLMRHDEAQRVSPDLAMNDASRICQTNHDEQLGDQNSLVVSRWTLSFA